MKNYFLFFLIKFTYTESNAATAKQIAVIKSAKEEEMFFPVILSA
jgi:hypothetical protein